MNRSMATVLISAALVVSLPAGAHTEEYFDSINAPHGGQMRMAGPYHLELVAKEKEIVLYVMDHADQKISTEGGIAKATIQIGKAKSKTSIKLEPAGENTLKGTGDFAVTPQSLIVVFLKLPEHEAYSARFTPLKPKANSAKSIKNTGNDKKMTDEHHHHMQH